jgi:integrase
MGRPRSHKRRNWPANLYEKRPGYFVYRDPRDGTEHGLGGDFPRASIEAMEANLKFAALLGQRRLVDRLEASGKGTVAEWIVEFRKILAQRKGRGGRATLAANTVRTNEWKLGAIGAPSKPEDPEQRPGIGDLVMERVTTKDLADFLQPWVDEGSDRATVSMRSMLDDLFRAAAGKGWVKTNPVDALMKFTAVVKRHRLSLDQFKTIYATAVAKEDPWVPNMLALAIVTSQPRECLVAWRFADERDGFLWNERGKTGARIKLPLKLRVPELDWVLEDVIRRCRDAVLSKHMLHHVRKYAYNRKGGPVFIDTATKAFARARDASGIVFPAGKEPPTLHEVRSLALRLYKAAHGRDFAQALAGHKSGDTTDLYADVRGSEWIEVRLG